MKSSFHRPQCWEMWLWALQALIRCQADQEQAMAAGALRILIGLLGDAHPALTAEVQEPVLCALDSVVKDNPTNLQQAMPFRPLGCVVKLLCSPSVQVQKAAARTLEAFMVDNNPTYLAEAAAAGELWRLPQLLGSPSTDVQKVTARALGVLSHGAGVAKAGRSGCPGATGAPAPLANKRSAECAPVWPSIRAEWA